MTRTAKAGPPLDLLRDGRISRRQFVVGALKAGCSTAGAATLLSACHAKSHKAAPHLTGRVQILVGFDGGNTAAERQIQQALAQAFIVAHPQVGIDFLRATSAAAAESQLAALIARGSAPDIVLGIGPGEMSRLVDQHAWLDLRPLIRRDRVSMGAFQSQATAAGALATYYGGSKAVPGIPVGVHDHAVAYNVDLFAKAGVPTPPASWSDHSWALIGSFLQAAQALTVDGAGKRSGQPGFDSTQIKQYGVARLQPEAVFFGFGAQIYDPGHRRAQFDRPAAIAGAQFAGDLVSRYHVQPTAAQLTALAPPPAPGGTSAPPRTPAAPGGTAAPASTAAPGSTTVPTAPGDGGQAAWLEGKLAMIDLCSCEINSPFATEVPFAWRAAPLPAGPARRLGVLEVSQGAIVAASKNHDLAWEVLKAFTVDPAQERQMAFGGFDAIPALSANLTAFQTGTRQATGVDPAVWVAGLSSSSADNDAWVPAFADVHSLMTDAFNQIAGGTPAATVMPQLQVRAQAKIDGWFKSHQLP